MVVDVFGRGNLSLTELPPTLGHLFQRSSGDWPLHHTLCRLGITLAGLHRAPEVGGAGVGKPSLDIACMYEKFYVRVAYVGGHRRVGIALG